jgi:hypothetical protein
MSFVDPVTAVRAVLPGGSGGAGLLPVPLEILRNCDPHELSGLQTLGLGKRRQFRLLSRVYEHGCLA